jgi:hypothetical protein
LSWLLYLAGLFLFFTASVHRNCMDTDNPLDVGKRSEHEFEGQWTNRNG